jgi:disulfide bond formation protein DsbB
MAKRPSMNPTASPASPPAAAPLGWTLVFAAWLIATVSTLGALFLGEVMGYTPCVLCWYQRIAMFPLVLVLAAGLFPFDPRVVRYALPLAFAGLGLALFHLALVAGWIPENIQPCQQGVPCSDLQVVWFGFVSIPLLSVVAFSLVAGLLLATHFKGKP